MHRKWLVKSRNNRLRTFWTTLI